MNNKIENFLLLVLLCIGLLSGYYTFNIIKEAYIVFTAENICIAEHVSKGVERKNIVRMNGTCAVKE